MFAREENKQQDHILAEMQAIPNYVGELRQKMGLYMGWIPNQYADAVANDNAFILLKNDDEITRCNHLFSCSAAGDSYRVETGYQQVDYILMELLTEICDFLHARKSLIENGTLFGLGVQRKYYKNIDLEFFPNLKWRVIEKIREVDIRRLRLEREEGNVRNLYWTIWQPEVDQYIKILDRNFYPDAPSGDCYQDYIWYYHELEETNPYFRGFSGVLYKLAYIKSKTLEYWAALGEAWGEPLIQATIDVYKGVIDADLGNDSFVQLSRKTEKWVEMLKRAKQTRCLVVDKDDDIHLHQPGSTGTNILQDLVMLIDKKINMLFLGAELTTAAGKGEGSYALGNVHREKTQAIIDYARDREQETLKKEIIWDLLFQNRENFALLGYTHRHLEHAVKFILEDKDEFFRKKMLAEKINTTRGDEEKVL